MPGVNLIKFRIVNFVRHHSLFCASSYSFIIIYIIIQKEDIIIIMFYNYTFCIPIMNITTDGYLPSPYSIIQKDVKFKHFEIMI